MSDEPINHKLLARNKHRGEKNVDKNTSRGKYKKQEYDQKKKEREELAKREQDPNYRQKSADGDNEDDGEEGKEEGEEDGSIKFNHSRSKYSKRVLLQNDHSRLAKLDEKYYNQSSQLNMQSLIDSKVDFIPKFDQNLIDQDNVFDSSSSTVNKTNNHNNDTTINTSEIEKMLSSFTLSKRLNIDDHYFKDVKLPNPSNITHLKRKSNKHLLPAAETALNKQPKSKQSQPQSKQNIIINEEEEIKKTPIVRDTADSPPIDNGNVTSDNLEDWLDSII